MAKPFEVTAELLEQIAQAASVREALARRARLLLPRAQRVAASAGALEFARALRVESGTRPGTKAGGFERPYARVAATVTEEMARADRDATLSRRQILRRATRA